MEEPIDAEQELLIRMGRESKRNVKECMRWERRILHSSALTLLTPEAIYEHYRTPTLPYPLLKLECQLLKKKLLPNCEMNELGGYADVPVSEHAVMDIERNQPRWRKTWLGRASVFKLHYVTAPQQLRIDPTFCPLRRRRDWETFDRLATGIRKTWLNYPLLQSPPPNKQPTETYVIDTLKNILKRLDKVPDLSCVMLVKIARMLITVITAFKKLPHAGPHWTTYFEGPDGIAWDLQEAPTKEILMGLYARCIYLPAHYMVTFLLK